MLALGHATRVLVYSAVVDHPRWHELAPALTTVSLPPLPEQVSAQIVPYYLRHLFWNAATSQLDVTTSAPFIAKRLLSTGDLDGLAWGATHLPRKPGIMPRDHGESHREIAHLRTTSPGGTVPLPDQIRDILPADTAMVWEMLAPAIPTAAYLAGASN